MLIETLKVYKKLLLGKKKIEPIGNSCFYDEGKQYIPNLAVQKSNVKDTNKKYQTSKGYSRTLGNNKYSYYEKRGAK